MFLDLVLMYTGGLRACRRALSSIGRYEADADKHERDCCATVEPQTVGEQ